MKQHKALKKMAAELGLKTHMQKVVKDRVRLKGSSPGGLWIRTSRDGWLVTLRCRNIAPRLLPAYRELFGKPKLIDTDGYHKFYTESWRNVRVAVCMFAALNP